MQKKNKEIGFLDSFSADTSVVPQVIAGLIADLKKMDFPQEEIDEIVLSMDESITNAIQETIKKNEKSEIEITQNIDRRDITIRYTITKKVFDATIIDHGKGLDLFNILNNVPNHQSEDYRLFDRMLLHKKPRIHQLAVSNLRLRDKNRHLEKHKHYHNPLDPH